MASFVAGCAHCSGGLAGRREDAGWPADLSLELLDVLFGRPRQPLDGCRMCGRRMCGRGATFVPGAPSEDSTRHVHLRVTPRPRAVRNVPGDRNTHQQEETAMAVLR